MEDAKAETEPTRRLNRTARCMKSTLREAETAFDCCKSATPRSLEAESINGRTAV